MAEQFGTRDRRTASTKKSSKNKKDKDNNDTEESESGEEAEIQRLNAMIQEVRLLVWFLSIQSNTRNNRIIIPLVPFELCFICPPYRREMNLIN